VAARLGPLLVVLALALPAAASAGTYDVVSCASGGGLYANLAWAPASVPAGDGRYAVDPSCVAGKDPLGVALTPASAFPAGTAAVLSLQAPPGTTIADYELRLNLSWAVGTGETTDALVTLGDQPVLGAGQWDPDVQAALDAQGLWPGYLGGFGGRQVQAVPATRITLTRAASPIALAVPAPTSMTLQTGCWSGARGGCSLAAGSQVGVGLTGSRVTIADPSPPALSLRGGEGLLAPGRRAGREAVGFAASDNTGIHRAELLDVTDPARPAVIGVQTGACDFRRTLPCQDLPAGSVVPERQLVGNHALQLRVTDAAGNQTASAPFAIAARGPGNGLHASARATLTAGFRTTVVKRVKGKRRRVSVLRATHTVGFGGESTLRGRLRTAGKRAIAGAELRLLARDARRGAAYVDAGSVRTRRDGSFVAPLPVGASRTVLVTYRAFAGDAGPSVSRSARLSVRAGLSTVAPVRVRPRRPVVVSGRLSARPVPARSVRADLQAPGPRRTWRTLRTTTVRANGRFALTTRAGSGGTTMLRVRVRPTAAYPYATAVSRVLRVRVSG
jgi:hypothetical protein